MIESNISNVNAAAVRQDVRSLQEQREANVSAQAEQASSIPMASSGVEAANNLTTSVSAQPAGLVTRLGETTEEVPLYDASRPTGSIIRPAIELAQQATTQTQPITPNERQAEQLAEVDTAVNEQSRPESTTAKDNGLAEMQNLV